MINHHHIKSIRAQNFDNYRKGRTGTLVGGGAYGSCRSPDEFDEGQPRKALPLVDNYTGLFTVDADKKVWTLFMFMKDPFHTLLTFNMGTLLLLFIGAYAAIFSFFTVLFYIIEHTNIEAFGNSETGEKWDMWQCFLCSWQTVTTVGYGVVFPRGHLANLACCLACVLSLVLDCFATGIFFAKMANAATKARSILHSSTAVITSAGTPSQINGGKHANGAGAEVGGGPKFFECRIHHASDDVLVDPYVRLYMSSWKSGQDGKGEYLLLRLALPPEGHAQI